MLGREQTQSQPLRAFAIAVLAVAAALLGRMALDGVLADDLPLTLFLAAVFVAAWYGGFWPGLLATALALLFGGWFFLLRGSWDALDSIDPVRMAVFAGASLSVCFLSELWQRARRKVEDQTAELRAEVEERRRSEAQARAEAERARAAEARLHLSEQLHRLAVEAAHDAIYDWTPQDDRLSWNDAVQSLFGYAPAQIESSSQWWSDRIHPEDRETVVAGLDRAMRQGEERWRSDYRFRRADGSYAQVYDRARLLRDASGRVIRIVGSVQDLSERKRTSDALTHFKALFEAAPACYSVLDPQFNIVAVSDAMLDVVMRSREELIGRPMFEAFPPAADAAAGGEDRLREFLETVRKDKRTQVLGMQRYPIPRPPSQGGGFDERWWTLSSSPVLGPDGELTFIINRAEDVTDYVVTAGAETALPQLESRAQHLEADIHLRAADAARANRIIHQQNERLRFLDEFDRAARDLEDPGAIVSHAAERLCLYLNVMRVAWAEIEQDEDHFNTVGEFSRGGPSVKGRQQLSSFGIEALARMRAGQSFVIDDTQTARLPGTDLAVYRAMNLRAAICVPILESGRFVAGLAVHSDTARQWSMAEIELVETVAQRAYESLERARIARELRASHARLKLLMQISDATAGMDDRDAIKRIGARLLGEHLQVNRALFLEVEDDGDMSSIAGQYCQGVAAFPARARISAFGKAALATVQGEAERGIADVESGELADAAVPTFRAAQVRAYIAAPIRRHGRLLGVMAVHQSTPRQWTTTDAELVFAVGNRCWESLRRVRGEQALALSAEGLRDANERLAFLMELGDTAQHLADPYMIMVTVAQRLCQRLKAHRCAWFDIEKDGEFGRVLGESAEGLPSSKGRYRFADFYARGFEQIKETLVIHDVASSDHPGVRREAFEAAGVAAQIVVPLMRGGRFAAGFVVHQGSARNWTQPEIELVEMVAQRCFETLERTRIARALALANQHLQCLFDLGLALEPLSDPAEMMSVATRHLGRRLGVSRCAWARFEEDRDHYETIGDYVDGQPSRTGLARRRFGDYGTGVLRRLRAGETLRSDDIESDADSGVDADSARRAGFRAFVIVPVLKRGQLMAAMTVQQDRPRHWQEPEVELLELFVQRCWETMERVRGMGELKQSQERLREADRAKDEFLATLAHELRNPLAPLTTAVHLLRPGADEALREKARQTVKRQLAHMVRLVDDLLDVSRIRVGKLTLRKEWVDLHELVRNAIEIADPQIRAARHRLAVRLPPQTISVDADAARLAQVIANLLNNSARYTPPGGRIALDVECVSGELKIVVEDDGVGISAEALGSVFEMFAQGASASAQTGGGGLGVGLSLVRKLVGMHGGTVEAHSEGTGRGSRFTVRLPASTLAIEGAAPTSAAEAVVGVAPGARRRILVADDNPDSVESMAGLLGLLGHEVRCANDGQEVVALAQDFRPDTIVMDIGMPRMDGLDAARHIRGQPWGASVTLIALTGWGQDDDRRRTREAGFDYHLVKPVELEAFDKLLKGAAR